MHGSFRNQYGSERAAVKDLKTRSERTIVNPTNRLKDADCHKFSCCPIGPIVASGTAAAEGATSGRITDTIPVSSSKVIGNRYGLNHLSCPNRVSLTHGSQIISESK